MTRSYGALYGELAVASGWLQASVWKQHAAECAQKSGTDSRDYLILNELLKPEAAKAMEEGRIAVVAPKVYRFGEVAVLCKFCGADVVKTMLEKQKSMSAEGGFAKLGEIMVREGVIKSHQIQFLLNKQNELNAKPEQERQHLKDWEVFRADSKLKTGDTLAHYKVESRAFSDPLGRAYVVQDTKHDRDMYLRRWTTRGDAVRKFMSAAHPEIKALSTHKPPSTVARLLPLEKLDTVHMGLRMQWVEGKPLCAEHGLHKTLKALSDVAAALAAVPVASLPHAYLGPSQILVSEKGVAHLINLPIFKHYPFPLAEGWEEDWEHASFLAPEVLLGGSLTPNADSYSLASILYYIVEGRHVASGAGPLQVLNDLAVEGARPFDEDRRVLSADLMEAVRAALHPDPAKRPAPAALAQAFEDGLAALDAGKAKTPSRVGSSWGADHARRAGDAIASSSTVKEEGSRKNKTMLYLLGVAAVVLVIVGIVVIQKAGGDGDADKDALVFEEPPSGYEAKIRYYDGIAASDPNARRRQEAVRRRDAIQEDMDRAAGVKANAVREAIDALAETKQYEALLETVTPRAVEAFYTDNWQKTFTSLRREIEGALKEDLDSLETRIRGLIASESYAIAFSELKPYDACDHAALYKLASRLTVETQLKQRESQEQAAARAEQEAVKRSESLLRETLDVKVNPAVRKFQPKAAIEALHELKARGGETLRKPELDQIEALLKKQERYNDVLNEFIRRKIILGRENIQMYCQGRLATFYETSGNVWRLRSIVGEEEMTLAQADLTVSQTAELLGVVLSRSDRDELVQACAEWLLEAGDIPAFLKLLPDAESRGGAHSGALSAPTTEIAIHTWLQAPRRADDESLTSWTMRVWGLDWCGRASKEELDRLNETILRRHCERIAAARDAYPIAIASAQAQRAVWDKTDRGIRLTAGGILSLGKGLQAAGGLFRIEEQGELEFRLGDCRCVATVEKDKSLRWNLRLGSAFEKVDATTAAQQWNSWELLPLEGKVQLWINGALAKTLDQKLELDADSYLEITVSGKGGIEMSDILVIPAK